MTYTHQSRYSPTVPMDAKATTNPTANAIKPPPKTAEMITAAQNEMKTSPNMLRPYVLLRAAVN